ncbi:hypothetical protein JTB14_030420 [Gonioctena quinquepunctata]|nr:hypothetical protein JTB14_030420 [Gonioctena quinquepunctata]
MDSATEQITEKLIENIKKHKNDLLHPAYKNNRIKNKIWDEIGTSLNIDGDEAKKDGRTFATATQNIFDLRNPIQFAKTTSNVNATVNEDTRNSQEEHHTIDTETYGNSQGFMVNHVFHPRELAMMCHGEMYHHLLRLPVPFEMLSSGDKCMARHLHENHHGLAYIESGKEYEEAFF